STRPSRPVADLAPPALPEASSATAGSCSEPYHSARAAMHQARSAIFLAMQLREYLSILRRYWPLVALLPLLVGGLSLALALRRPPTHPASAKLLVTQAASDDASSAAPDLDDSATWTTTEYILDDLPHVLQSVAFAEDVRAAMAAEGYPI